MVRKTSGIFTPDERYTFMRNEWTVCDSTFVVAARWHDASQTLTIRFKDGHVHEYPVDLHGAISFALAPSKGGWLHDRGVFR